MENEIEEDLAMLICLTKKMTIVLGEMQKVCNELLENSKVQVSTISPEDYD